MDAAKVLQNRFLLVSHFTWARHQRASSRTLKFKSAWTPGQPCLQRLSSTSTRSNVCVVKITKWNCWHPSAFLSRIVSLAWLRQLEPWVWSLLIRPEERDWKLPATVSHGQWSLPVCPAAPFDNPCDECTIKARTSWVRRKKRRPSSSVWDRQARVWRQGETV